MAPTEATQTRVSSRAYSCRVCQTPRVASPSKVESLQSYDRATRTYVCRRCTPVQGTEWRAAVCPACRQSFRRPRAQRSDYCGRCGGNGYDRRREVPPPPKEPFNRFLYDWWLTSKQGFQPAARQLGLSRAGFKQLLWGARPTQRTVDCLRAYFGDCLPPVETHTERLRERVRYARENLYPQPGSPAYAASKRKAGLALRGRRVAPDTVRRRVETQRAAGLFARKAEDMGRITRQPKARAARMLSNHLRASSAPSAEQIREWAGRAAQKIGLPRAAVLALWRPRLQERGLAPRGGRPQNEKRHQLVAIRMASWPRKADGDLADGFWDDTLQHVRRLEREKAPATPDSLMEWWYDHRKKCPHTYAT
jgi:hypothetical protein